MGQDPRSSTYSAPWNLYQTSPDDLRGYRASVADAAAANAAEERERLINEQRYALTSPGSGIGLETQEFGIPAGMNEYMGVEDWLGVVPKDPRDVGTLGDFENKWGQYRDTSNMGDYRRSVADATAISGYDMPDRAKRNLSLLTDLDRMGTDAYRFANTAPVSIGERESGETPLSLNVPLPYGEVPGIPEDTPKINENNRLGLMNTGNLPAEMMMAELTPKQQEWMRSRAATPDFISPDYSYKHVQGMENKPWDFQWGEQEPTTREEFDEYYNYLLANPSLTSWQT